MSFARKNGTVNKKKNALDIKQRLDTNNWLRHKMNIGVRNIARTKKNECWAQTNGWNTI